MLEVLSTIGLTASAAIVIGYLAYAMAETPRGRCHGRWRSHRLVRARAHDRRRRRARPRPRVRRSRSGPDGRVAGRCAGQRLLRLWTDSGGHAGDALAGAGRGECDPNPPRVRCLCFSTLAANCRRHSRRARAGATFSPAPPRCPSPGRSFASADVSRRSFLRGASSGSQISSTRSRLAPYRPQARCRCLLARRRAPS